MTDFSNLIQDATLEVEQRDLKRNLRQRKPNVITDSKTKFWREKGFWKDRNPISVDQFVEERLGRYPSPGQMDVLFTLAGKDPFEWDTTYQEYVFAIGQGGGKNRYIVAPFVAYLTYKIANMKDPWRYFSRFLNEPLGYDANFEISNSSAVNEDQAKGVHFRNMSNSIKNCLLPDGRNWFEVYARMDMRSGVGDMKEKKIFIPLAPNCGQIILHSFDSTPTAPEGKDLICGIQDETSRAETAADYAKVEKLHDMIIGNLNTRYPNKVGKYIAFSYLNDSEFDFTWALVQRAEEQKKRGIKLIYAVVKSTFEMNPNASRDDESIKEAYRVDPVKSKARYDCIKGASKEGFYEPYTFKIKECFYSVEEDKLPVSYSYDITERAVTHPTTGKEEIRRFRKVVLDRIKGDNRMRAWAYDPSESFAGFILKGGYVETMDAHKTNLFIDNREELVVINKRPIIDITIAWQPEGNIPVDYINFGEVFGALLDKFPNSVSARSDKYNSVKLMQELMDRGLWTETLGFGIKQQLKFYTILRWMFIDNIPAIYKDNRVSITKGGITKTVGEWNQFEHENLLRINKKITHPPGGSSDFTDVDSILVNDLAQIEVKEGISLTGVERLSDQRILALAEKYMRERQKLLNAGIHEKDHVSLIAVELDITVNDAQKLKEHVESEFGGYLNV